MRRLLLSALLAVGLVLPAAAQTGDQNDRRCNDRNPDISIPACNAVIQDGKLPTTRLETVFLLRGMAYNRKKQYDKAIADYDSAIRLQPDDADVYFLRGLAYATIKRYDRAIQDFDQRIKLKPSDALAFKNRGVAKRLIGDTAGSDADFAQAKQLTPSPDESISQPKLTLKQYKSAMSSPTVGTYSQTPVPKMLVACIDWSKTTDVSVDIRGSLIAAGGTATVVQLKAGAMTACVKEIEDKEKSNGAGCSCQIIDVNGKPAQ